MPDRHHAVAAFYVAEAERLRRSVARSINAPPATIDDACQQAWLELLRHDEVELGAGGYGWLRTVAIRKALDMIRRERRTVLMPHATDRAVATWDELLAAGFDSAETFELRRTIELLHELPDRERRVMWLHAAGFTHAEIGRLTGYRRRTVANKVIAARRRLRTLRGAG